MIFSSIRQTWYSRSISLCIMITFVTTMVITPRASYAQEGVMGLPQPGTMVNLSPSYVPLMLTGLRVHPENPLLMDFIVSTGNSGLNTDQVKEQSDRLIKYFLACLTIPEKDQWVNLSPYEKERIVPEDLGQTVLGQDMLEQDYLLKQLTASLIYPEKNLGKNFWDKVYAKANQMYGTTQIPVNTFNKVWILPDSAKVYEHKDTVLVVKSHLKVMLDEDYLALSKHVSPQGNPQTTNNLASNIVRQIVLPAIEQEVNKGQNFAQLRQIYNSMILAVWFKNNLKQAFLNQIYTDKSKVNGVNVDDPAIKEKIYKQYLQAYKKGVFNYIKEEHADVSKGTTIARKYFSGGLVHPDKSMIAAVGEPEAMQDLKEGPAANQFLLIHSKESGLPGTGNGFDMSMTAEVENALSPYSITLDYGIFKPEKVMPAPGDFKKALDEARAAAIGNLKSLGKSREEAESLLKQEFEGKKGIIFNWDEGTSILRAVHDAYAPTMGALNSSMNEENLTWNELQARLVIDMQREFYRSINAVYNGEIFHPKAGLVFPPVIVENIIHQLQEKVGSTDRRFNYRVVKVGDSATIEISDAVMTTGVKNALSPYNMTLDYGIFQPEKAMPAPGDFLKVLDKARAAAIGNLKSLGKSREEAESLLKQEFEGKKGIIFTWDEGSSILRAVHDAYAPAGQDIEDDNGPQRLLDVAMNAVTAEELLRANPTFKVASDADQIRNWVSPHGVPLEKILNSVIKEYDVRGYDGGDDQKFPAQLDDTLWRWIGRSLGSDPFISKRHQRTVGLEPGDFYLIAGDNGPSTGGLGEVFDKAGKKMPNVIEAISNGFTDTGVNVINLNVVGAGALYSTAADLMEELKKSPIILRIALEEKGIKLSDAEFDNLKRVKGAMYVTRSHVEIGTNGVKPNIDGITLYGDMLQTMKPFIVNGIYREVAPEKRGKMFQNDWMREVALDIYKESINSQFSELKASLEKVAEIARKSGKPVPQVIANFSGGSLAATKRKNGEKYYLKLLQEVLGDNLKLVLRFEGDTWNENGGLADPTRLDAVALGNPKANIVQVSTENPNDVIINFDLDADRISILQNGRLFLGDEMFYPVIEYQLTLDPYAEIHRTQVPIYFDSRMKSEFAAKVRKHGGIAKIHPKGHSKVKATIDIDFMKVVNTWAAATGSEATKEAFLKAHPGFKIVQAEYSTHMFMTDTRGNAFDDAFRFGLFWLQAFAEIQIAKDKAMTVAEYIQADKDEPKNPLPDSKQLKEQRTSVGYIDGSGKVVPVSDEQKKALIYRMTDKVKAFFAGRTSDFEYIPDWEKYEGNNKPFTLVEVEGVYHLFINKPGLEGEIFWGWSNTSNKVAFGTQSPDANVNKQLAAIAVVLLVDSRKEIAAETGLNWIRIEDLETKALSDLFGGIKATEIEDSLTGQYPNAAAALKILDTAMAATHVKIVVPEELRNDLRRMNRKDMSELKKKDRSLIDRYRKHKGDQAALAKTPEGGIDLNSRNLNMESEGQKVDITFDAAMIAQFKRGDFSGVRVKILDVVPISLIPLLGLKEGEESERIS